MSGAMERTFSGAASILRGAKHVGDVTDIFGTWDYVDGVPEHWDGAKQAEIEAFARDILKSAALVREYVKLMPAKADKAVAEHNLNLARLVDREWRKLGLVVCAECGRLMVPERPKDRFCAGCWSKMLEEPSE